MLWALFVKQKSDIHALHEKWLLLAAWEDTTGFPVRPKWTRVHLRALRYGCINQRDPTFSFAPDFMNHKQDDGFKNLTTDIAKKIFMYVCHAWK